MTRTMKGTFLACAILGLGFGAYLGHWSAVQTSDSLESIQYIGPAKIASDFARTQFMHSDTDHARQAVMLQIRLLEKLSRADKTFHEDGQLALAYVRLAMVEDAAGQPDAEHRALVQARTLYKQTNARDQVPTDDEFKDRVKQSDSRLDRM